MRDVATVHQWLKSILPANEIIATAPYVGMAPAPSDSDRYVAWKLMDGVDVLTMDSTQLATSLKFQVVGVSARYTEAVAWSVEINRMLHQAPSIVNSDGVVYFCARTRPVEFVQKGEDNVNRWHCGALYELTVRGSQ